LSFKRRAPECRVIALDNLKRRGSELALRRLAQGGVEFRHGDIRNREDLTDAGPADLIIECSAEASVHAGLAGGERYLINTNLVGTINCLDHARVHNAGVIFLSTSRVYPIASLREISLVPGSTRFVVPEGAQGPGWTARGIAEDFPLTGSRSLYGASKLCSELIITEYVSLYGLRAIINRCGVLTGPWQMGKVDQGFVVLWAARHLYGGSLAFRGFGGRGLQVRDILHIDDLCRLVTTQADSIDRHSGKIYNVGGGIECSTSLFELTEACAGRAKRRIEIDARPQTDPVDIPFYVSDCTSVSSATGWQRQCEREDILDDIFAWLRRCRDEVEPILSRT